MASVIPIFGSTSYLSIRSCCPFSDRETRYIITLLSLMMWFSASLGKGIFIFEVLALSKGFLAVPFTIIR